MKREFCAGHAKHGWLERFKVAVLNSTSARRCATSICPSQRCRFCRISFVEALQREVEKYRKALVYKSTVGGFSALTNFCRLHSGACTRHLGLGGQTSPHAGSYVAIVSSCSAHSPLPRRGSRRGTAHGPSGRLRSQRELVPPPRGRGTAWCANRRTAPVPPYPGLSMHFPVDAQQKHMFVSRATEQGLSIVHVVN